MIVYPAIDLRGGKVVRLKEGDPKRETVFSDEPLTAAQLWIDAGTSWIHMVNLDGAFASTNDNGKILKAVAQLGVKVQFGGGLRQLSDIEEAFGRGAARVVLGTIAVQQPEIAREAVERWGTGCICVALDALNGKIATHGWQQVSDMTPIDLGKQLASYGVQHALFTDVGRDGGLQGVNVAETIRLAHETGLRVIASGGVQSLDDVRQLKASGEVAGVVIGMALYEGKIRLPDALAIAGGEDAG